MVASVIKKANLSLTLREVTNLSDIFDAKIETVPTLEIRDKVFTFSERTSVNLKLKDAIKYLLQIHNYGDWSCIALPLSRNTPISKPFLYAHHLAEKQGACLEIQFVTQKKTSDEWEINSMIQKIRAINREPMDLILSRPIVSHASYKNSVCAHIKNYVLQNKKRTLVVSSSIWEDCKDEVRQIQTQLTAPLLSISENCSYQSKMKANWYIDPAAVGSKTRDSICDLFMFYDIEITVVASSAEKTLVTRALHNLMDFNSITFQWEKESEDVKEVDLTRNKMIILNSSKVPRVLGDAYSSLNAMVKDSGIVAFLPEKCRSTGGSASPKQGRERGTIETEVIH